MGASTAEEQRRVKRLAASLASNGQLDRALFGRRDVLRLGGFSVATSALLAACAYDPGEPGRVGDADELAEPPTVVVTNGVLLRTASSLERSAIAVYEAVEANGLVDETAMELVKRFVDDHRNHAQAFDDLTRQFDAEPFLCSNPKYDSAIIAPLLTRILDGAPATSSTEAIKASDNPQLDVLLVAHGLENLAGASYQALVPLFTEPSLRADAMAVGATEARHAALLAFTIPGGSYLPTAGGETNPPDTTVAVETTVPKDLNAPETSAPAEPAARAEPRVLPVAIPSQFGQLGAYQIIVGAGDENGVRMKANLETPSLNSLIYDEIPCAPS